jgi:hypothetical protein
MNTLTSVSVNSICQTPQWGQILSKLSLIDGQAALITIIGNTATVYTVLSSDSAIGTLIKTQVAQEVIS